jgi:hypothetical protein
MHGSDVGRDGARNGDGAIVHRPGQGAGRARTLRAATRHSRC